MKNKNRQQQRQQQHAPRVTVGRSLASPVLQSPVAKMRADLENRERESRAIREANARVSELEAELEETKWRKDNVETVVALNARGMGLTDSTRLDNIVENAYAAHRKAGKPFKEFPVYDVINDWKAKHGRAVPRPKSGGLDAHLPPPAQQGHARKGTAPLPGDAKAHDATMRQHADHGANLRDQERQSREAYQDALKRHGLTDPSVGSVPGDPRGYFG